jgi:hypothetical protein
MTTLSVAELCKRHNITFVDTRKDNWTTDCPECSQGYLNVKKEKVGIAFHCHGCGWEGRAPYEQRADKSGAKSELGEPKTIYDYEDENGERLFQVLRFEPINGPKKFLQRASPDQKKWSIKGVRLVPYKLPELIEAVAARKTVFVAEGEKDVLTLHKWGLAATCNAMGAGKWRPAYNVFFKGADVVVIADYDGPGRDHARSVANHLVDHAASVRLLSIAKLWPNAEVSDDITDWFERGRGSVDALLEHVAGIPHWSASAEPPWEEEGDSETKVKLKKNGKGNGHGNGFGGLDGLELVAHAAAMDPLQYGRYRQKIAKQLGFSSVSYLDQMVKAQRRDGLQGQALEFPEREPWPQQVDLSRLLEELSDAIRSYVVMPKEAADVCALWALHTYLMSTTAIAPILTIRSPEKQCGKTTLLDVLAAIVHRPLLAANISPAALFRTIPSKRPTLMLDEGDGMFRPENEELRCLVNACHRRGQGVIRTVGEQHEPRVFDVFCAMAIALIGHLPGTIADRSITISLRRRRFNETVKPFRLDKLGELEHLARQAVRWAQDNEERLGGLEPELPASAINRIADNWRPLFRVAQAAGGGWPERTATAFTLLASREDDSVKVQLLSDIRDLFEERQTDKLSSETIVEALGKMEGRSWAEFGKRKKPITKNALARLLKDFEIKPEGIRIGLDTPNGYTLVQFRDAFECYLPQKQDSNLHTSTNAMDAGDLVFSNLHKSSPAEPSVEVENREKFNNDGLCGRVEVANPENGEKLGGAHLCHYCGQGGELVQAALPNRPGVFGLHQECVPPWYARETGRGRTTRTRDTLSPARR